MSVKLTNSEIAYFIQNNTAQCDRCLKIHQASSFAQADLVNAVRKMNQWPNSKKCKALLLKMRAQRESERELARAHVENDH